MSEHEAGHFIQARIDADLASGRVTQVVTRFPPEPNGFLHIGHVKAIALDFGMASRYGGRCTLRFDDTNPLTEETRYVEGIQADIRWLGFDWGEHLAFASDYFGQLYDWAEQLVLDGKAFVDSCAEDEIRAMRGTVTEPGTASPWRERPAEENLDLLREMRAGAFPDGTHVLRAKIDMSATNMKMRDPLIYRIRHAHHHRTGDAWCIYPFYDYAHCLSDAIEGVTHSLCTLEFDNNRELYDWFLEAVGTPQPRPEQIEFARLNITHVQMSKRKLLALVRGGHVRGWDDPRMPTLVAMRRRGYPPEGIRAFIDRVGVAKADGSMVDAALLDHVIRDHLNTRAPRVMAVIRPLKVVIDNWPGDRVDWLEAPYWPHDVPKEGTREVPFTRELWIERDDFHPDPPRGFRRLVPGGEVRLRYGWLVRCTSFERDASGEVSVVHCTYDPDSRGGQAPDGRKVKSTIHWVSATVGAPVAVRLFSHLFPDEVASGDPNDIDPDSWTERAAFVEPSVLRDPPDTRYQFERLGYFWRDPIDKGAFNRIVALKDSWRPRRAREQAPTVRKAKPPRPSAPVERSLTADQRAWADRWIGRGVAESDSEILAEQDDVAAFFDKTVAAHDRPAVVAKWVVNAVLRTLKETSLAALPFGPAELAALLELVDQGILHHNAAKEVYAELASTGGDPRALAEARGLTAPPGGDLAETIDAVIAANPDPLARYRAGNDRLLGFFVGQVMKQTRGRADPKQVNDLLLQRLSG